MVLAPTGGLVRSQCVLWWRVHSNFPKERHTLRGFLQRLLQLAAVVNFGTVESNTITIPSVVAQLLLNGWRR